VDRRGPGHGAGVCAAVAADAAEGAARAGGTGFGLTEPGRRPRHRDRHRRGRRRRGRCRGQQPAAGHHRRVRRRGGRGPAGAGLDRPAAVRYQLGPAARHRTGAGTSTGLTGQRRYPGRNSPAFRSRPMDDQHDSAWADAMLRRPAVDPGIPGLERALLTAPGTLLTPACHARPARNRDYLPTDPDKRGATIDGAVMGMTAAAFVAIGGATPLAIGTLIFQNPVGWQSVSGRYGLFLAEILAIITAVVFVTRIVRFGQPGGRAPADVAARTYHGRYLTAADFDGRSRVLLWRAQDAVDGVTSSEIYQAGLLDAPAVSLALAGQEWDIALILREQARLRATRARLSADGAGPQTAAVLDHQVQAAELAEASVAARVGALEATRPKFARPTPPTATGGRPQCWPRSADSTWTCSPGLPPTSTASPRSTPCHGRPARSARRSANHPASPAVPGRNIGWAAVVLAA